MNETGRPRETSASARPGKRASSASPSVRLSGQRPCRPEPACNRSHLNDHRPTDKIIWESLVGHAIGESATEQVSETRERRRCLVLDLPVDGTKTPTAKIPELSTRLARKYATKTNKTLNRDLNALEKLGLIVRDRDRGLVWPDIGQLDTLMPIRANRADTRAQ